MDILDRFDWRKLRRLWLLSGDDTGSDLLSLITLIDMAKPLGVVPSAWAHHGVADVSCLDRLYHVGLIHLYSDPPCCATVRKRGWYSIHRWDQLS